MVIAYTDYRRYNTHRDYEVLSQLFSLGGLKHNLFIPTMKGLGRRYGRGKMRKVYETKNFSKDLWKMRR